MSFSTTIVVEGPVDPTELFHAALNAVGLPADAPQALHKFGDTNLLQALGGQGAIAQAMVHYPPAGGLFPRDAETDAPDGYALVQFDNAYSTPGDVRAMHRGCVERLAVWLGDRGLTWQWQFDDGPWER